MREISAELITTTVKDLCMNAACDLPNDVENLISSGLEKKESQFGKYSLEKILKNIKLAREEHAPMCQDTGITVIWVASGKCGFTALGNSNIKKPNFSALKLRKLGFFCCLTKAPVCLILKCFLNGDRQYILCSMQQS